MYVKKNLYQTSGSHADLSLHPLLYYKLSNPLITIENTTHRISHAMETPYPALRYYSDSFV